MTEDVGRVDPTETAAGGPYADEGPPADLTLNAEVNRICIVEGGYPAKWPRHSCCPCCGTGQIRPLFTKHQFNHSQCANCGFVCVDPYPPDDILKKLYAGAYYTNFREYYEARHLREVGGSCMTAAPLELLEQMIAFASCGRETGDWLDVGGGLGTVADLARRRCPGWAVTLNEFNPRSLELAREIYGLDAVGSDARQLRRMPRRFDVISAISVLEHIPDPLSFLRSYVELLKPDGIMAVIIPHFTGLNAAVSKAAAPNATPPFHVSLFRRDSLSVILRRVGLFGDVQISAIRTTGVQFATPLRHEFDTGTFNIPSLEEPVPRSLKMKEYPVEIAVGLNALEQAEEAVREYFAETDGRLYLMAICRKLGRRGATS